MNTAKTQQTLAFAAMCVDLVAQAEGCSSQEMYQRLKKVGLIHGLTTHLDALHTQSKEYVTNDLLQALHRLEAAQTNKQQLCAEYFTEQQEMIWQERRNCHAKRLTTLDEDR